MTVPKTNHQCVSIWSKCSSTLSLRLIWIHFNFPSLCHYSQNHHVPLQEDNKNRILLRKRLWDRSSPLPVMLTTSYVLSCLFIKKNFPQVRSLPLALSLPGFKSPLPSQGGGWGHPVRTEEDTQRLQQQTVPFSTHCSPTNSRTLPT